MITSVGLYHEPIRKRPWLVCWWGDPDPVTGKQRKYTKTFRYQRAAKIFHGEKQSELDRGAPRDKPEEVTLDRLLREFTEARLSQLSYSSQSSYQNTTEQLREYFGDQKPIRKIDRRQAESFLATRKRRDGRLAPLSSWSKARYLIHCRAIFSTAESWGYVPANPFSSKAAAGSSSLCVRAKARPWQHIKVEEFQKLLSVTTYPRQRVAYWLMYGCGLRPGEVYNCTLDWFDLDRRVIRVKNRAATADVPPFTVKADDRSAETKERTIPIPEAAVPDITEAMQTAFRSGGFVVLSPERYARVSESWKLCRAGKPWGGSTKHRPWQNRDMMNNLLRDTKGLLMLAGVELTAPFTLPTLRKSFAQNCADKGVPPRTLAKMMGHSTTRVTMEYYNRVTDENERAAARTLDRMFDGSSHDTEQRGAL